jgi:hypothetical protein
MAHVAGVDALGSCENVLDAEPDDIHAMTATIKMMTLLLIWGEGDTLHVTWLSNPGRPVVYGYKSSRHAYVMRPVKAAAPPDAPRRPKRLRLLSADRLDLHAIRGGCGGSGV